MLILAGELALTIAAAFTGAAVYINVAEQPARLRSIIARSLSSGSRRISGLRDARLASPSQVDSLGLVGYVSALDWRWLLGAIVLLANWPYTRSAVVPTNNRLMNTPPEAATAETRGIVERWGALHAGRSAPGLLATLIFLWAPQ